MKSLRELYRIGKGPSSSHTMGPAAAAAMFRAEVSDAVRYRVELYGSLAATGRGHMTDRAVISELGEDRTEVVWKQEVVPPFHLNGLRIFAYDAADVVIREQDYYSVGGGAVSVGGKSVGGEEVYGFADMCAVLAHCNSEGTPIWAVVDKFEAQGVWDHMSDVLTTMDEAIERGLVADGALPGGLNMPRRARSTHLKAKMQAPEIKRTGLLVSYAQAVAEENAALGRIVTAPTCGSCGVLPAVLRYMKEKTEWGQATFAGGIS